MNNNEKTMKFNEKMIRKTIKAKKKFNNKKGVNLTEDLIKQIIY
jgi:hypothetical protein